MDKMIIIMFSHGIKTHLEQEEQVSGQLKYLSTRHTELESSSIDRVTDVVTNFIRNQESPAYNGMYNIKIFTEDSNFERQNIRLFATFYNYFLLNTNFSTQNLLSNDMIFGKIVGLWPTLSPYLFIQIIWHLKCEDLLIESFTHIPLDVCAEILEIIITHIHELSIRRARRLMFLLIYKIYNKCLWLHLGTVSEQNVKMRVDQLITYFEVMLDTLSSSNFVTFRSSLKKYFQHGILLKNILHYIKKCMHSQIKSYSENHNLVKLFRLTYGKFNGCMNCYHKLPANEVKSIITRLNQKLIAWLLNQIKDVEYSEFIAWGNVNDNENTMMSLQRAIILEYHCFMEFMKQNKFLTINEDLPRYLERFVCPRKPEESILTLRELCHEIARGKRTEKYRTYVSVLKILIQLTVKDMHSTVQNYVEQHFDDNPLENLYDERCFVEFVENISRNETIDIDDSVITQELRTLLIFILLNPKDVLSKCVMYEIANEFSDFMFRANMSLMRSYYCLTWKQNNLLVYILKDILFQQRVVLCDRFKDFLERAMDLQMITADDILNELYVNYLVSNDCKLNTMYVILQHVFTIVYRQLYSFRTQFEPLITALLRTLSHLRRCNKTFPRIMLINQIELINKILEHLYLLKVLTDEQRYIMHLNGVEPLEMNKIWPTMTALEIIEQYEARCNKVYKQLRKDPRCHPKLRKYVQSFKLDKEAIIRHIIMNAMDAEYVDYAGRFTLIFFSQLGWANEKIAFENVMRITAETSLIALMYIETFSKNTFLVLIINMIIFAEYIEPYFMLIDRELVRRILLETLSSMNHVVSRTRYGFMYNHLLKHIQKEDLSSPRAKYFVEITNWTFLFLQTFIPRTLPLDTDCTCDKNSYCQHHSFLIENNFAAKYDAHMFITECLKLPITLSTTEIYRCFDRLLRNLCSE
ncbi:PREDICTED: uncharacterized protein LOC105459152 isoform X2 [Wasmannia auropunctata]|uniref:uncharacterized protein LOC105459152 isoform X2 n=1 Tax=Wasmannia auropunctata TaxID=64793 RepID=UPI0005EEEFFE|nr:PREDICTED: uncharacterized protein LOC105459152 isoform X2 [Wasmannia auropunctata]